MLCETRPKETLLCSITTYLPYLINLLQLLPNSVQTYVIDMRRRKNAIRLKRGKIRSRREAWGSKKKPLELYSTGKALILTTLNIIWSKNLGGHETNITLRSRLCQVPSMHQNLSDFGSLFLIRINPKELIQRQPAVLSWVLRYTGYSLPCPGYVASPPRIHVETARNSFTYI